ncbi:MAG: hypothetical protein ABWY01_04980 [Pseudoxanthomonas sp.]
MRGQRRESAERLTAADRPGVAQPVPVRPVPDRPWAPMLWFALLLLVLLLVAWEWRMRALGLAAGDLEDGGSAWAEQRRRIDAGDVAVAIVGDSRILFDTDLDRFQQLTGVRPVQLALPGTNARPFLQDLAGDPDFRGLAIVGIADRSYFRDEAGLMGDALEVYHYEAPSRRSGYLLQRVLDQHLAFLDDNYRLSTLVHRLDPDARPGASSPRYDVWKLRTSGADRQSPMWPRIETDRRLRQHARQVWMPRPGQPPRPPPTDAVIARTLVLTREAVGRIRARGGDVVFVRPPSAGALRIGEERGLPRRRGWDRLLRAAGVHGLHFEDYPAMRGLDAPEWSHLSRRCATVFTDAYVRELARVSDQVLLRADAPRPLGPADCEAQVD